MRSPAEKTRDPYAVEQRSNGRDLLGRTRPAAGGTPEPGRQAQAVQSVTLPVILRVLRRRRLIVALSTLVVAAAALILALAEDKQYASSASLLFRPANVESSLFDSASAKAPDANRAAATNTELAGLDVIADRTARRLDKPRVTRGFVASSMDVFAKQDSDLATVTATTTDPALSSRIANVFAEEYMALRRRVDRASVRRAQRTIARRIAGLSPRRRRSRDGRRLRRAAQELEVLAALRTGSTELVQPALKPRNPVSPKPKKNLAVGILLGLMVGVSLAFVREFFDRRLHDEADAERAFSLPVLATMPPPGKLWGTGRKPPAAAVDSFRMLRASLRYFSEQPVRSLLVMSDLKGEGSSAVAWNLALAEAQTGRDVLLVEADLRRGGLARRLKLSADRGLSLFLAGEASLEDSIFSFTDSSGRLDVVPAGPLPPNPSELLETEQMAALLSSAEERYGLVIVDAPSIAAVSDAVPLAGRVGGVVLVAALGRTTSDGARGLRERLDRLGATVLGVVTLGGKRRS